MSGGILVVNREMKIFKDYNYSKLDKVKTCDEVSRKCKSLILATKICAVAVIVLSIACVYFGFLGAASVFAPLGIFAAETSLSAILGTFAATFICNIPTKFFFDLSLKILIKAQKQCREISQVAKQRKLELLIV